MVCAVVGPECCVCLCVQAFILSGLLRPFFVEVLVIMIHPLPFVNYIVHVWGLDTYCAYSSDGPLSLFPCSSLPPFHPSPLPSSSLPLLCITHCPLSTSPSFPLALLPAPPTPLPLPCSLRRPLRIPLSPTHAKAISVEQVHLGIFCA